MAVPILLIGGLLAERPGGASGPTPTSAPGVTTVDSVPDDLAELPTGSPTDGLGTKMPPVRAYPDKDLVDGQQVRVVGSGFPPHAFVGGVMCTGAAKTQGAAACDLTNIGYNANADAEGNFELQFPVRRFPLIQGRRVDCMAGNVDPDDYAALLEEEGPHPTSSDPQAKTCIIAVGEVSNYDNSGGWPIAFRGEVFRHGDATSTTTSSLPTTSPSPTTSPPSTTSTPPTTSPPATTTTPQSSTVPAPTAPVPPRTVAPPATAPRAPPTA